MLERHRHHIFNRKVLENNARQIARIRETRNIEENSPFPQRDDYEIALGVFYELAEKDPRIDDLGTIHSAAYRLDPHTLAPLSTWEGYSAKNQFVEPRQPQGTLEEIRTARSVYAYLSSHDDQLREHGLQKHEQIQAALDSGELKLKEEEEEYLATMEQNEAILDREVKQIKHLSLASYTMGKALIHSPVGRLMIRASVTGLMFTGSGASLQEAVQFSMRPAAITSPATQQTIGNIEDSLSKAQTDLVFIDPSIGDMSLPNPTQSVKDLQSANQLLTTIPSELSTPQGDYYPNDLTQEITQLEVQIMHTPQIQFTSEGLAGKDHFDDVTPQINSIKQELLDRENDTQMNSEQRTFESEGFGYISLLSLLFGLRNAFATYKLGKEVVRNKK